MKDFRDLKVWQKGHQLAISIYRATAGFPKDEIYALTNQMRRAGVSIPTNIAGGCGRNGDAEFAHLLHISMGSASELEYLLLLSRELRLLDPTCYERLAADVTEVKRMLAPFIQKLKADR